MNIDTWIQHFQQNHLNRREPAWNARLNIPYTAWAKLTRSIQQFQLGDGGGPAYLIAWNRERLLGPDPGIRALVDLWFAEEAEHSRLLGKMLARLGGKPITSHWSFGKPRAMPGAISVCPIWGGRRGVRTYHTEET